MPTLEIEAQNWQTFFDEFSKQHPDTAATIQVINSEIGAQEINEPMPLAGISFDNEGSGRGSIIVMLGDDPDRHMEHMIDRPTHVWFKSEGEPLKDALEIEDADKTKTIVQLQPDPESLN